MEPGLRNARFHGERGNGTYARKSSDLRIRASRLVRNAANTSPERSEIHSLIISSLSRSFVSLLCSLSFCVLSFLFLNFFFFNPSHQPFDLHTNFCLPHPFLPPSFQTIPFTSTFTFPFRLSITVTFLDFCQRRLPAFSLTHSPFWFFFPWFFGSLSLFLSRSRRTYTSVLAGSAFVLSRSLGVFLVARTDRSAGKRSRGCKARSRRA